MSCVTDKPVLVTGATGFVASHIIEQLLKKGYKVRGTVRSLKNKEKNQHLLDMDPSGMRLELVEADLIAEGSFDLAVLGCEYVMHTASPYIITVKDPQRDLVDPAVQGTLSVLRSCLKQQNIRRVVLTSSVAAITDSPEKDKVYDEKDWNMTSSLTRNPYYYSKKLAEEAAWNFIRTEKTNFSLVVINPYLVIGPEHTNAINTSNQVLQAILTGKYPAVMDLAFGFVDVRDVAQAHILAMENPTAEGRYICWNQTMSMKDVCALLRKHYPQHSVPTTDLACCVGTTIVKASSYFQESGVGQYLRTNLGKFPKLNNEKVKGLGLQFIPVEKSILDTCADLEKKGHLKQ